MSEQNPKKLIENLYRDAPQPHRRTMLKMRKSILEIVPGAEEVMSYGMPAFKVSGNIICGLKQAKNHVGYYPFSGSILQLFSQELEQFSHTKSAIHVPIDKPLSKSLIRKLIQARISQCPIKRGNVKTTKYEELDRYWRSVGIAAPARRGLVDNKILKLNDLKRLTEVEFLRIHGMGPAAAKLIVREMRKARVRFRPST